MNKKIIVIFLLLGSFVMFTPERSFAAAAGERSVSVHANAGTTAAQRRRRKRRRMKRVRHRVVYHYGYRNGVWYRSRIN